MPTIRYVLTISTCINEKTSIPFCKKVVIESMLLQKVFLSRPFGKYLDGGLIANNPTLDALTEIQEYCLALKAVNRESEAAPVSLVVSIGTGHIPVSVIKNMDMYRPDSIYDNAKLVLGINTLGTLIVDQV